MTYEGTIRDGVVVLPRGVKLPEGAKVRVEPVVKSRSSRKPAAGAHTALLALAGKARGLPADMSRNHDHYLHGRPKH